MSAGHHTTHHHSDALVRELRRLLADPRVEKLLARPRKASFKHEMPLTGGSTVEWGTFFLDPILRDRFKVGEKRDQDLAPFVLVHEIVEKALRMALGMGYDRAHQLATTAERLEVEGAGLSWAAYKGVMRRITDRDERERPKSLPKDYDYGPLRASRGMKSLRGLKVA